MKKIIRYTLLIFIFLSFFVISPLGASAKTIAGYRQDLKELEQEKKENESGTAQTKEEIAAIKAEMLEIQNKIEKCQKETESAKEEISRLETEIKDKEEQIKELVAFLQVSNGENFYLKYVFGAETFTDLIYRISIVQQLTTKNDELVDEMNGLIKQNKEKLKELADKEVELESLNTSYLKKASSLKSNLKEYNEEAIDIDAEIAAMKKLIAFYVKEGCGENQNLNTCVTAVPYDYGFNKPLKNGRVTDEFGMRYHPTKHIWTMHRGIDLGGNKEGTNITSPAVGKVVAIYWKRYCGGTQIFINHIVNGKYYTTQYMHVLSVKVSVGEVVSKGQTIGTVGGGAKTRSYDHCSTGAHLHFQVATGHYFGSGRNSYSNYSTYAGNLVNPRSILYFPAYGVSW